MSHFLVTLRRELASVEKSQWNEADDLAYCHPGTRVELLEHLKAWSLDVNSPAVFWLTGLAGTGKSTISRSFCRFLDDEVSDGGRRRLAGSFFISRQNEKLRDPSAIVRVLAYGLALQDRSVRSTVLDNLKNDPDLVKARLSKQVELLVAQPLAHASRRATPLVFVVDAFDECNMTARDAEAEELIPLLADAFTASAPRVKLLITSRPEPRLRAIFRGVSMTHQSLSLHDNDPRIGSAAADIQTYLQGAMALIAHEQAIPPPWPAAQDMGMLIFDCGELFIVASTMLKFVKKRLKNPKLQLQIILDSANRRCHGGRSSPYHALDTLYGTVIENALTVDGPLEDDTCAFFRLLVGSILTVLEPLSALDLSMLLQVDKDAVEAESMIAQLHAVLLVTNTGLVHILHPSFPDYLLSSVRCTNQQFHVDVGGQHMQVALACLHHMNGALQHVIWDIDPVPIINSEIPDLTQRMQRLVPNSLRYACQHWMTHLARASALLIPEEHPKLQAELANFCSSKLVIWVEINSLLGTLYPPIAEFDSVHQWLQVCHVGFSCNYR